ncbi:glycoside hydrolase family 2 [Luteimonas aquatica]|uniref:glycoside hydrolase family 2 n=1 Tax=Luteimonas aquatica TaxID=450364 RepID=UPI001F5A1771|nr:glycoside hydrolase family 2 [Luteimonas aquatica]
MLLRLFGLALLLQGLQPAHAAVEARLAAAEVPLTGPWQFRFGNDPQWATPQFDDSGWERMDLTPPPGAHDGDVGLPGYVPGWSARGHSGRWGHAWYRLRVHWSVPEGMRPVLMGPTLVDDAYEIFWNGRRIGGIGDFGSDPPRAYTARPKLYALPESASSGDAVVAVHVYLAKRSAGAGEAGGMHVAPILAGPDAGAARLLAQWWQTFWGYAVEVVEPMLLLALALYALSLRSLGAPDRFWAAAAIALVLVALNRFQQAVTSWTELESLDTYEILRLGVLGPLTLGAWVIAWNRWVFPADRRITLLAIVFMVLAAIAGLAGDSMEIMRRGSRLALLALFAWAAWNIFRRGRGRVLALVGVAAVGVGGMFAEEINAAGVPGIWFPFGVGVSRSQYALAVAIPLLAVLFHCRAVRRMREAGPEASA